MYLTKEYIFQELISPDMKLRSLGADEVRDMIEFDSIAENEIPEYIDHLLKALQYDNTHETDNSIIFAICFLFDSFNIASVNLTPFMSIIEGTYRKKKFHDDIIIEIIWMFARRHSIKFLPAIKLCTLLKNQIINAEAEKAEEYILKHQT